MEFPIITTFYPGFQSFWFSCSKGASFFVFHVAISAKLWHPLIYFALATISSTLQPILWPFHVLKLQFPLTHLGGASPYRAHYRDYPLYPAGANWLGGPSQVQVIVLLMCIKTSWTMSLALNQAKISSNVPGETIQFFHILTGLTAQWPTLVT